MVSKYKVFDIFWETDGHDLEILQLPKEVAITLEPLDDPDECLADKLSNIFGWCVNSFDYEAV